MSSLVMPFCSECLSNARSLDCIHVVKSSAAALFSPSTDVCSACCSISIHLHVIEKSPHSCRGGWLASIHAAAVLDHELDTPPRHQRALGFFVTAEHLLGNVLANVLYEVLELVLHAVHLLPHVQNNLDSGKVYAQVTSKVEYQLEAFDVLFCVIASPLRRSRRRYEPLALIETQRLRVNAVLF